MTPLSRSHPQRPPRAGRPGPATRPLLLCLASLLSACASLPDEPPLQHAASAAAQLAPAVPPDALARPATARADALLAAPLGADGAVELTLRQHPRLAAELARARADESDGRQAGSLPGLVFSLERVHGAGELAIARTLSVGLMELLTWPQRQREAAPRIDAARLRAASAVVDAVGTTRNAWVEAVASREQRVQAERVREAAAAGAELARRLQRAGNWSELAAARQQAFEAEADAQLIQARLAESAAREALVRALGLDEAQAQRLQLPDRLPALPAQALAAPVLGQAAAASRLDLRLAQAELDAARAAQGLATLPLVTDLELAGKWETAWTDGERSSQRGAELSLRLAADGGAARRGASQARTEAAWQGREQVLREASSQLREAHAHWLAAWQLARHHRDVTVPLRQRIAEQSLLNYNGMLGSVFELLADARSQASAVQAALAAQAQFWRADAALQASLLGRPSTPGLSSPAAAASPAPDAGH